MWRLPGLDLKPDFHIIANTLTPFVYEIPIILGLPPFSKYRARFPIEWVDKPVLQDPKSFIGRGALLSLRDWNTGQFTPIRHAIVTNIELINGILFIDYHVTSHISHDKFDIHFFNRELNTFYEKRQFANMAQKPLAPLVFATNFQLSTGTCKPRPSAIEQSNWSETVKHLKSLPIFNNNVFLSVRVRDVHGRDRNPKQSTIALRRNHLYEIEIFYEIVNADQVNEQAHQADLQSRTPESEYMPGGPYNIQAVSCSDSTKILYPRKQLSGDYDILKIPFTYNGGDDGGVHDIISVEYPITDEIRRSFDPTFQIRVRYSGPIRNRVVVFVLSAAVYSIFKFSHQMTAGMVPVVKEFVTSISLVISVIQALKIIEWIYRR